MPVMNMPQDPTGMVPDWLNPYANAQSGQESGWPIDASAVNMPAGIVRAMGSGTGLYSQLRDVPALRQFLDFLENSATPINITDLPQVLGERSSLGVTQMFRQGIPSIGEGLMGSALATPTSTTDFARNILPSIEKGAIGYSPINDPLSKIEITLNPYAHGRVNANPLNTLTHELNHAELSLLPKGLGELEGKRAIKSASELSPESLQGITTYQDWQLPTELRARLFADKFFNPFLR